MNDYVGKKFRLRGIGERNNHIFLVTRKVNPYYWAGTDLTTGDINISLNSLDNRRYWEPVIDKEIRSRLELIGD